MKIDFRENDQFIELFFDKFERLGTRKIMERAYRENAISQKFYSRYLQIYDDAVREDLPIHILIPFGMFQLAVGILWIMGILLREEGKNPHFAFNAARKIRKSFTKKVVH